MKKNLQYFLLLVALFSISFSCDAQFFKPVWVDDIGGTGDSKASNIAADSLGDIYVSGYIRGTVTFNMAQGGSQQLTSNGDADVYIAKYNIASGNYIWAISFGGAGTDQASSMAVDNLGNVIITGQYTATANFNPKGSFPLTPNGADDIFVAKYTSAGNFVWAFGLGGADIDRGHYVAIDNQNNVFLSASYTGAVDVDPSAAVHSLPDQGSLACFFAKYDANGNFIWAHPLGIVTQSNLTAVAVDKVTSDLLVTGDFSGTVDFSYTGQASATFSASNTANFLARYKNDGTYEWVNYLPGSGSGIMSSITIDHASNIIITGNFGGNFYPAGQSGNPLVAQGTSDVVLASYQTNGNLKWSHNYGSNTGDATCRYVCTDEKNNLYISGWFSGSVVIDQALNGGTLTSDNGSRSVLIAAFNTSGTALAAGSINGNCDLNLGYEIAAKSNSVYVAGSFCNQADFNTSNCLTDNISSINSTSDSFLADFQIANNASSAQITSFQIFQQTVPAQIDTINHIINVIIAPGSDIKSLTPLIGTSAPATVTPSSGTAEDFTSPVTYSINNNCSTVNYIATVFLADSVCSGALTTLTGSIENPIPGAFAWQLLQNNIWVNAPGTFNTANYQTAAITNTADTVAGYKLRRQITVNGTINYDSFYQLFLVPPATISNNTITAPNPSTICAGVDPGVITGSVPSGIQGPFTYQWQSSADSITFININGSTGVSYDPGALSAATYYRRVIATSACSTPVASNVVSIKISDAIANNTITPPAVIAFCIAGNPGIITGSTPSGGNGIFKYQWQLSKDSINYTNIAGDTSKDLPASGPLQNTVYFRRTVMSGSCSTPSLSNVIKISVYPAIKGNSILAPLVSTFCSVANPGTISGSPTSGGSGTYSYQWQTSSDSLTFTTIAGTNTEDYDPGQVVKTAYFRRLVTSGPCDTPLISNVVKFTISNVPANPVPVAASVQICSEYTATLSVTTQPGLTYDWYDSAARTNLLFTGPVYTTNILNATTVFYVDAQNASCNSAGTASIQVVVIPSPGVPAVLNSRVTVCLQTPVTLSVVNPQQGDTYNWYIDAAGGVPVSTGADFTTALIQSSTAYYVDATNANGCVSAARTVDSVIITPPPQVVAQAAATCPGSSAIITAITTDKNATVSWYADATGGTAVYTGLTFNTPPISSAITYYAEAIDNVTGCISPFRFPVTVELIQPLPAPVVTVLTSTISSVTFQWAAVGGATGYQVSIDGGKTYMEPSGGTDSLTTTISGLTFNQTVTIVVRATGDVDCKTSDNSIPVTGTAINFNDNLIYVANAFTPNGDGKNDIVYVHSENIRSLKFDVFDQWGELLFTSTNVQKGWDGYYKGTKEPVGVYVYFLAATMNDGKQVNKKGTITLLR